MIIFWRQRWRGAGNDGLDDRRGSLLDLEGRTVRWLTRDMIADRDERGPTALAGDHACENCSGLLRAVIDHDYGPRPGVRQTLNRGVDRWRAYLGFDGIQHKIARRACNRAVVDTWTKSFVDQAGLPDSDTTHHVRAGAQFPCALEKPITQPRKALVLHPWRSIVLWPASPVIPRPEGSTGSRLSLLSKPRRDGWMASHPSGDLVGVPDLYLIGSNG